jgi:hypothetical protein
MKPAKRHFVLRTLVVVNLLVIVAVVAAAVLAPSEASKSQLTLLSCVHNIFQAQMVLLPIWGVLGTARIPLRVVGLTGGCALLVIGQMALFARVLGWPRSEGLLTIVAWQVETVALQVAIVAATIIILWLNGLCLLCFPRPIAARRSIWPQFSLWQLLVFTSAVAAVLAVTTVSHSHPWNLGNAMRLAIDLMNALGSALLACAAVWSTLSTAKPDARVVITNALVMLFALASAYARQRPLDHLPAIVNGALVQGIWLTGSLLVVRACGYRALWPSDWVWAAEQPNLVDPHIED